MSISGVMRRLNAGAVLIGCSSGVSAAPPNPTLTAGGLQIDYRSGPWTATGTGYYVSNRNAESGARAAIWLPAAAVTYETGFGALALSDRNRLEQLEGPPGSPTLYRNRANADWHVSGRHALTDIFIADQVLYDFSSAYGVPDRLNVLGLTFQFDIKQ